MEEGAGAGRAALIGAVVFVVLFVISGFVAGMPEPGPDGLVAYFTDKADAVRTAAYLGVGAGVGYLVFLAGVRVRLRASAPVAADAVFAAGLALGAASFTTSMVQLTLAASGSAIDAGVLATLAGMTVVFAPLLTGVVFLMAAGVAIASLRFDALPGWVGGLSALYAVYEIVESLTITGQGTLAAGGVLNQIGLWGFMVWVLVVGVGAHSKS